MEGGLGRGLRLLTMLLEDFWGERRYWDRMDCLNSDGRRLLHSATKALLDDAPWLSRLVYEARREPCFERLSRLVEGVREAGERLESL